MKHLFGLLLLALLFSTKLVAQDDLFGTPKKEVKHGFMIAFSGGLDVPMADMATRFGVSNRVGPAVYYKSETNWMFGCKGDFLFGRTINEPGFLSNVLSEDGTIISNNGLRTHTNTLERGFIIAVEAGKILKIGCKNPDNGLLVMTSLGFVQHKILIANKEYDIEQLNGEYLKGYDRLANGISLEEFVGYNHFSYSGLVNFTIGVNVMAGFTQGRRDYLFDVMKPGTEKRFDMLVGIKANWYIPLFRRKSEDYYFE